MIIMKSYSIRKLFIAALLSVFSSFVFAAQTKSIDTDGFVYAKSEGQSFLNNRGYPVDIRYGQGNNWVTYANLLVNQTVYCTATDFGIDPSPGLAKTCWWNFHSLAVVAPPPPEPPPSPDSVLTPVLLSQMGISTANTVQILGWGFAAVIMLWSFGFGIGAVVKMVRRI